MDERGVAWEEDLSALEGATVLGSDGSKIGKLEQVWVDQVNRQPEWASVKTGVLGMRSRLVPMRAAEHRDDTVVVKYTKDEVEQAPEIDPETAGPDDELRLYRHYRQPLPAPPPPQVRNPFAGVVPFYARTAWQEGGAKYDQGASEGRP
ncbi:MAG: PRC-barrel domain-containing protein [Actinobacteria bacterium]|nr:PRC-barrel domain-containing protein [Actinomycetota bacterium]